MKLKKAAVVTAAAAGLVLAGSPALAAPSTDAQTRTVAVAAADRAGDDPTFGDAVLLFIEGGGALGYGAAALIAGAYTGIALTPALVAHSFGRG